MRDLRLKRGLSMRAAGQLMGYSNSYISQVENGRVDPPKAENLSKFLNACEIRANYFSKLVSDWRNEVHDADIIRELLPKLNDQQIKMLRVMAEQFAESEK